MKKTTIVILVLALAFALAAPGVALAGQGNGKGKGKAQSKPAAAAKTHERGAKGQPASVEESPAVDAGKQAAKADRKAAKVAAKEARKAAKAAAIGAGALAASDDESGSVEPSESVEGTKAVGPGVSNAFSRITANLEKSLAKIEAGTKKQLPPGLVKVWMKFAGWLGVDPATMPGASGSVVPPHTSEPSSTVEPTQTVVPTSTVEPTVTPVP